MTSFTRPRLRLLIVGCGDVGLRVARLVAPNWRVIALTSSPSRVGELRAAGLTPIVGDLDDSATLHSVAALADRVLYLAPPNPQCQTDRRLRGLLRAFARAGVVQRIVVAGTTGVYGDVQGRWIDETAPLNPGNDRSRRRVDAEHAARRHGIVHGVRVSVLRIPGIYALDRVDGNPLQRAKSGRLALRSEDDVYTNRIQADDLARACVAALMRAAPGRCYNVCDQSQMLAGDVADLAADRAGVARPERVSRDEAMQRMSAMSLSFLSESRRLTNVRMTKELRLRLRYPSPVEGFVADA